MAYSILLNIIGTDDAALKNHLVEEIIEMNGYQDWPDVLSDLETWGESAKWEDLESNMITLSRNYPELLFIVQGTDGYGDYWQNCYKTGLVAEWHAPEQEFPAPVDPTQPVDTSKIITISDPGKLKNGIEKIKAKCLTGLELYANNKPVDFKTLTGWVVSTIDEELLNNFS